MHAKPLPALKRIARWWHDPEATESRALRDRTHAITLPAHITWTLIALIRYRERKRWMWDLLVERIPNTMAAGGADVTKEKKTAEAFRDPVCGIVPGMPEWNYRFQGHLSFATNSATGERLHLDLIDGPDDIKSDYFRQYLQELQEPTAAERRLLELFPDGRGLLLAHKSLRRRHLFHRRYRATIYVLSFQLCGVVDEFVEPVLSFLEAWEQEHRRPGLAAMIGDWDVLLQSSGVSGDFAKWAYRQSETARQRWLTRLQWEANRVLSEDVLDALADAGADDLPVYLIDALAEPRLAPTALEIIGDDPTWVRRVESVFQTALSDEYFSDCRWAVAVTLARNGADIRELVERLLAKASPLDEPFYLALYYGPEHLLPVVRRRLRSQYSGDRLMMAAILARLDTPASRRELLAVLEESADQDATVECRAALRMCSDPEAHSAVDKWEAAHPEEAADTAGSDRAEYEAEGGIAQSLRRGIERVEECVEQIQHAGIFA